MREGRKEGQKRGRRKGSKETCWDALVEGWPSACLSFQPSFCQFPCLSAVAQSMPIPVPVAVAVAAHPVCLRAGRSAGRWLPAETPVIGLM